MSKWLAKSMFAGAVFGGIILQVTLHVNEEWALYFISAPLELALMFAKNMWIVWASCMIYFALLFVLLARCFVAITTTRKIAGTLVLGILFAALIALHISAQQRLMVRFSKGADRLLDNWGTNSGEFR